VSTSLRLEAGVNEATFVIQLLSLPLTLLVALTLLIGCQEEHPACKN